MLESVQFCLAALAFCTAVHIVNVGHLFFAVQSCVRHDFPSFREDFEAIKFILNLY